MNKNKTQGMLFVLLSLGWMIVVPTAHAQAPSIITQPASQSSAVGGTIQFTVSATGGGTLAYQWRKNTTNLANGTFSGEATVSGATTTVMTLTTVTTNDQANYTCYITNSSGSITSSVASLSIFVPPSITTQPKSYNTNVGANVTFTVVAGGTAPFSYQWYLDDSPISGATLNSYALSGLFTSDSGTYNVRVSNAAGTTTSSNAILNVGIAPAITGQPTNLIVTQGQSASFSVTATGTPLNYYWKKNGTFIPGQTNSSLNFASVVTTNAATYTCQVSNFLSSVTSAGAMLTVDYPPSISVQPASQTIGIGSNFTVSVTASGNPALAYQWRMNEIAITTATAPSYTVTGAQTSNSGNYDVIITNSFGSVTSSIAVLLVGLPPQILNVAYINGLGVQLQVSGTPNFPYVVQFATNLAPPIQWQSLITNATDSNGLWQFTDTNLNSVQKFYSVTTQ